MVYIDRNIEEKITKTLDRGKSVLLLGPRQAGKTTLTDRLKADLVLSFLVAANRQRYERQPDLLVREIMAMGGKKKPLVVIDEIQKVPAIMDTIQLAVDRKIASFVLTGSSARKLRRQNDINLLPGRIVSLRLDPLNILEHPPPSLETSLLYGSLPQITLTDDIDDREDDLRTYVETYLEEEIRAEALVRDVSAFGRFLELAGIESGNIVNFNSISQEIGVHHNTVKSYFEILNDCFIAERIDPVTRSASRRKLTRSSRYFIFDLGVRRACAREGTKLIPERMGQLFEQFVCLNLIFLTRNRSPAVKIKFWRDPDGPEVDFIIEREGRYVPIEVKWSESPDARSARHLETFMAEYDQSDSGYVVCRTPRPYKLTDRTTAIPWQDLPAIL